MGRPRHRFSEILRAQALGMLAVVALSFFYRDATFSRLAVPITWVSTLAADSSPDAPSVQTHRPADSVGCRRSALPWSEPGTLATTAGPPPRAATRRIPHRCEGFFDRGRRFAGEPAAPVRDRFASCSVRRSIPPPAAAGCSRSRRQAWTRTARRPDWAFCPRRFQRRSRDRAGDRVPGASSSTSISLFVPDVFSPGRRVRVHVARSPLRLAAPRGPALSGVAESAERRRRSRGAVHRRSSSSSRRCCSARRGREDRFTGAGLSPPGAGRPRPPDLPDHEVPLDARRTPRRRPARSGRPAGGPAAHPAGHVPPSLVARRAAPALERPPRRDEPRRAAPRAVRSSSTASKSGSPTTTTATV